MDRNSAIGLTLMALLLIGYFYWFAPKQEIPADQPAVASVAQDTTRSVRTTTPDSTQIKALGDIGTLFSGTETSTKIETQDIKVTFSNKGTIRELELIHYKTYAQTPLLMVDPTWTQMTLKTKYQGKDLDLYALYYNKEESKVGDTTVITFSAALSNGASIRHAYSIPDKGYEIRYRLDVNGFDQAITSDNLVIGLTDAIRPLEKDLDDTRKNTTITYYEHEGGFDNLAPGVSGTEKEVFAAPVSWVAVKKKFFLSSIIAESGSFSGGEIETLTTPADSSVVKHASVRLNIPKQTAASGANIEFYFGPNDYHIIDKVDAEDFAKNVNLGWKPIYWINKYVIFPVFNFLTKHIANYGVIIIILVILLRLVLAPLSYTSFLSMAKMKVLKPELDEIKERVGDDMAKVQQEQLKLYQQVGVNPISGCIPVLLQMPLLFAMFYLFPASIELRQQPFLWAEDLSTYDSLVQLPFVVPFLGSHISLFTLLMTVTTLIYTWQNNQLTSVTGPMKSMSYIMPLIFFFVLNTFSAGLTFYYFMSTLFTFAQQAIIRRFVDDNKIKAVLEENRKKNAASGGTGSKSKFMNRLQEAMKAGEEARRRSEEEKKKKK